MLAKTSSCEQGNLQHLGQPQLPRRIALELHSRAEQDQKIRFARNMVIQLGINQISVDLLLSYVALLCHLGQCARKVDDGVAAVMFREKKNGEMLTFLLFQFVVCALRRRVGRGVRGKVGCTEGEGGLSTRAEVGF